MEKAGLGLFWDLERKITLGGGWFGGCCIGGLEGLSLGCSGGQRPSAMLPLYVVLKHFGLRSKPRSTCCSHCCFKHFLGFLTVVKKANLPQRISMSILPCKCIFFLNLKLSSCLLIRLLCRCL